MMQNKHKSVVRIFRTTAVHSVVYSDLGAPASVPGVNFFSERDLKLAEATIKYCLQVQPENGSHLGAPASVPDLHSNSCASRILFKEIGA